jgi:hypothetical protein
VVWPPPESTVHHPITPFAGPNKRPTRCAGTWETRLQELAHLFRSLSLPQSGDLPPHRDPMLAKRFWLGSSCKTTHLTLPRMAHKPWCTRSADSHLIFPSHCILSKDRQVLLRTSYFGHIDVRCAASLASGEFRTVPSPADPPLILGSVILDLGRCEVH